MRLRTADPADRADADHAFLADPADTQRLAAGLAALDSTLARLPIADELGEPPHPPAAEWLQRHHEHY